jgi:hypothetical protein
VTAITTPMRGERNEQREGDKREQQQGERKE